MIRKEWLAEFRGHRISVENAWGLGMKLYGPVPLPAFPSSIKLYIDGECVDTTSDAWGSKRRPLLRGRIVDRDQVFVVEAYLWSGLMSVKARITVNGQELPATLR